MSFLKGMALGVAAGAIAGAILTPKPKHRCLRMRKSADKAAKSIGELVDSIIAVLI